MPRRKSVKKSKVNEENPGLIAKKDIAVAESTKVKLEEAPIEKAEKGENNCLNCRWKKRVAETGSCPAIGKKVDLKKPVYNCPKFRKNGGFFY